LRDDAAAHDAVPTCSLPSSQCAATTKLDGEIRKRQINRAKKGDKDDA